MLIYSFKLPLRRLALPVLKSQWMAQIQQLKDGFGLALAVLFMFGCIWGIVKIWSGANAISKGDPDGKAGIIAGIIIAAAASIMSALFAIFGLEDAVIRPRF